MAVIREIANKVFTDTGKTVGYKIGTMIEIPRAALVADEVRSTYSLQKILKYGYVDLACRPYFT